MFHQIRTKQYTEYEDSEKFWGLCVHKRPKAAKVPTQKDTPKLKQNHFSKKCHIMWRITDGKTRQTSVITLQKTWCHSRGWKRWFQTTFEYFIPKMCTTGQKYYSLTTRNCLKNINQSTFEVIILVDQHIAVSWSVKSLLTYYRTELCFDTDVISLQNHFLVFVCSCRVRT